MSGALEKVMGGKKGKRWRKRIIKEGKPASIAHVGDGQSGSKIKKISSDRPQLKKTLSRIHKKGGTDGES